MKKIRSGKSFKPFFLHYSKFLRSLGIFLVIVTSFFICLFITLIISDQTNLTENILFIYQIYIIIFFWSALALFILNFLIELLFAVELGGIKVLPTIILAVIIINLSISMRFEIIFSVLMVVPIPFMTYFYFLIEIKLMKKISENLK